MWCYRLTSAARPPPPEVRWHASLSKALSTPSITANLETSQVQRPTRINLYSIITGSESEIVPVNNPLSRAWSAGQVTRGAWCTSPSSITAEALATIGFDYVGVDMQHGAISYSDAVPMLQAIAGQGAAPIVRVMANDLAIIGKALDAGAVGIVVPLVSSPEEAAKAVAACRYPPLGARSYGPIRASVAFRSRETTDLEQVVCAVMIETLEGLARVDQIAATAGLDVIYVGPADLALSLGLPPAYELDDERHEEALRSIRLACKQRGIVAGIHCDGGEMAARRLEQGFQMVTLVNDVALVKSGASSQLALSR